MARGGETLEPMCERAARGAGRSRFAASAMDSTRRKCACLRCGARRSASRGPCAMPPRSVVARRASSAPPTLRRLVLPLRDGPLHAHAGKFRASVAHAAVGGCHAGRFAL